MTTCYAWFLESKDGLTNEAIARMVGGEDAQTARFCEDGRKHDLWQCDFSVVNLFVKSAKDKSLKFAVWNRRGNGRIRKWPFSKKRKKE